MDDAGYKTAMSGKWHVGDNVSPIERGFVIQVEAFDWNCPKYITPRYSEREVAVLLDQVRHQTATAKPQASGILGSGALPLTVAGSSPR